MRRYLPLLIVALAATLAACASQPYDPSYNVPGFFSGLWHGLVSPIALIAGIFSDIRIYAFPNSGWFYDLGFCIGAGGLGIGLGVFR